MSETCNFFRNATAAPVSLLLLYDRPTWSRVICATLKAYAATQRNAMQCSSQP